MGNFYDLLIGGTMAGVIKWTSTGTEVRTEFFGLAKGYRTNINGYSVEIIVKQTSKKKLFFSEQYWAAALSIKKDGNEIILTSDPESIEGTKSEDIHIICVNIQKVIESKDITASLSKEIASMLYN